MIRRILHTILIVHVWICAGLGMGILYPFWLFYYEHSKRAGMVLTRTTAPAGMLAGLVCGVIHATIVWREHHND